MRDRGSKTGASRAASSKGTVRAATVRQAEPTRRARRAGGPAHHVLITGATGFVGKVLVAELLRQRSRLGLGSITLLIRSSRGQSAQSRFAELLSTSHALAATRSIARELVTVVEADLVAEDLGLSPADRARLLEKTTHIIHCAASVNFDLPLKEAAASNIYGSLHLLSLAKEMRLLERLVVTSTAYVTPWRKEQILPELVALPRPASAIWADIEAGLPEAKLLREAGHPNTYTYTKCIGEHLLAERREHVPLSIVRPSIVSASWRWPLPGWIDSRAAFAGFVVTIGTGLLRVIDANHKAALDLVPVDIVAARLMAAAFGGTPAREHAVKAKAKAGRPGFDIRFAVAGAAHSAHIGRTSQAIVDFYRRRPVGGFAELLYLGPRGWRFTLSEHLGQSLPLAVATRLAAWRRDGRRLRRLSRIQATLKTINDVFPYFTHRTFHFVDHEPLPSGFSAEAYVERVCSGALTHLLPKTSEEAPLIGGRPVAAALRGVWFSTSRPKTIARRLGALIDVVAGKQRFAAVTLDEASFQPALTAHSGGRRLRLMPLGEPPHAGLLCRILAGQRPDLGFASDEVEATAALPATPDRAGGPPLGLPSASAIDQWMERGDADGLLPVRVMTMQAKEETARGHRWRPNWWQAAKARLGGQGRLRAHLSAGEPIWFDGEASGKAVRERLQAAVEGRLVVSRADLQAFLWLNPQVGLDLEQMSQAVASRGGQVLASPVATRRAVVDLQEERAARRRWQTLFYADLLAHFAGCWPIRYLTTGQLAPIPATSGGFVERRLARLMHVLAAPYVNDFAAIVRGVARLLVVGERATTRALLAEAVVHDDEAALTALVAACEAGLLIREDNHGLGQATVVFRRIGDDAVVDALITGCRLSPAAERRPAQAARPQRLPLDGSSPATLH